MSKTPTPHPLIYTEAWRARQIIGTLIESVADDATSIQDQLEFARENPELSRKIIRFIQTCLKDCKANCTRTLKAIESFEAKHKTKPNKP